MALQINDPRKFFGGIVVVVGTLGMALCLIAGLVFMYNEPPSKPSPPLVYPGVEVMKGTASPQGVSIVRIEGHDYVYMSTRESHGSAFGITAAICHAESCWCRKSATTQPEKP